MSDEDVSDRARDPDDEARIEALRFVARRTAIWAIPLLIVGLLLTALGLPWWLSAGAAVITLVIVVFEIDL